MSATDYLFFAVVAAALLGGFAIWQRRAQQRAERAEQEAERRRIEAAEQAEQERRQRVGKLIAQFDDV